MPVHKRRMTNVSSRVTVISYWRSRWLITLRQMNYGCNDVNDLPLGSTLHLSFLSLFQLFLISFLIAIVVLFDFGQFIFNSQTTFALKFCHLIFDTLGKMFFNKSMVEQKFVKQYEFCYLWNNSKDICSD